MSVLVELENCQIALISRNATIEDVIKNLEHSGLQIAIILTDNGEMLGVITDGDVRRGFIRGLGLQGLASDIMNDSPVVVPENWSRKSVLQLMQINKLHQIPVISENKKFIGLHILDEIIAPVEFTNTVIIMAGGRGTRLYPATKNCPKPMLKVKGKPILEHILEKAISEGFKNFVISINYLGSIIRDYFGNGEKWKVKITYLEEENPLGTAGALSLIKEYPDGPFIVTNGDLMCDVSYKNIIRFHEKEHASATMVVRHHEIQNPFGVIIAEGSNLLAFDEKPVYSSLVNTGVYVLSPSVLRMLETGKYCDMPNLILRAKDEGGKAVVFPIHETWLDIGRPADLAEARLRDVN